MLQYRSDAVRPAPVDAIVVPTARPAESLKVAIDLAGQCGCVLVALCSRQAVSEVVIELAQASGVELVCVDVTQDYRSWGVLPDFNADQLLDGTAYERRTDVGFKRNLALLLALLVGWRRMFFLDDDIVVDDAEDLRRAAGLLRDYPAVGLEVGGFPDNSVVCHANRAVGSFQDTFIGGGAMAVDPMRINSFYPKIYNEDWFLLVGGRKSRRYAVVGEASQAEYDPYDSARARSEEFGDCVAEGVYALLDVGRYGRRAVEIGYWEQFLAARRSLIEDIVERIDGLVEPADVRKRMCDALHAAYDQNRGISPGLCVEYLAAWRADRERWLETVMKRRRLHLNSWHADRIDAAIRALGLTDHAVHVPGHR